MKTVRKMKSSGERPAGLGLDGGFVAASMKPSSLAAWKPAEKRARLADGARPRKGFRVPRGARRSDGRGPARPWPTRVARAGVRRAALAPFEVDSAGQVESGKNR
jgi:hypothetical protein